MLPAPGQGALAVEVRADDVATRTWWLPSTTPTPARASTAERAVLDELEAGCSAPVGALAEIVVGDEGDELSLRAVVASPEGAGDLRRSPRGESPSDASAVGRRLARLLLEDGAADLMSFSTASTINTVLPVQNERPGA